MIYVNLHHINNYGTGKGTVTVTSRMGRRKCETIQQANRRWAESDTANVLHRWKLSRKWWRWGWFYQRHAKKRCARSLACGDFVIRERETKHIRTNDST
jgi:hypothetical protein